MSDVFAQVAAAIGLLAVFLYALCTIDQMQKPPSRIGHAWVWVALSTIVLLAAIVLWPAGLHFGIALFATSVAWVFVVERRGLRPDRKPGLAPREKT
ncbi:MAG TPA: hypothetical protein VL381_04260 [Rhodocyclaceae bacterium]|nr:hypothetical protein [Rhodocyclaceae bacterium]